MENDLFEHNRRIYETSNEARINLLQLAHFSIVFVGNIATRYLPIAPYEASNAFVGLLGLSLLFRVALFFYFKSAPRYDWRRKYFISSVDLVIFTLSVLLLSSQRAYSELFLSLFAVCIFSMLVVLNGLRYDRIVMLYNGIASIAIFACYFPWQVDPSVQMPVLGIGIGTLAFITVVTAYTSESLLAMHREAVTKQQLTRFLPPELVNEVFAKPELLNRQTELRTATVVFADLRGFTALSEKQPPKLVVEKLNEFLDETTTSILGYQGMVDKYIGDAVLGVFGVPLFSEDHALRAVKSALEICKRVDELNAVATSEGFPQISCGIGIHTGELLIGVIGSKVRFDYTVIGDTVNVASRVEGLTRIHNARILCTDATKADLPDDFELRLVGKVGVKNREEELTIWTPDDSLTEN